MRSPLLRTALLGITCVGLLASACRTSSDKKLFLAPRLSASALFVMPFGFRWSEPAYRSFEMSQKILSVADIQVGDKVLLFGPSDFKVYRDWDNSWAGTNAVTLLASWRIKPDHALVLRSWVEKRVANSRREVLDAKGRAVGVGAAEETTYVVHVEILHPSTQTVAVDVSGELQIDPFAEKKPEDEADPAPELTRRMQQLTTEALAELSTHLDPPRAPRALPFQTLFNPKAASTYAEADRPSLELLAAKDPLEGEVLLQGRVRFANPTLTDAEAAKLLKRPGGLLVTQGSPGSPVKAGDFILEVGGQPALPQTLQRARYQEGVLLKVLRPDGTSADVVF